MGRSATNRNSSPPPPPYTSFNERTGLLDPENVTPQPRRRHQSTCKKLITVLAALLAAIAVLSIVRFMFSQSFRQKPAVIPPPPPVPVVRIAVVGL